MPILARQTFTEPTTKFTVVVTQDQYDEIKERAYKKRVTLATVINEAVSFYLKTESTA